MQDDTGLRKALGSGWIYSWFQTAVGAKRARRWLAANVWKCNGDEKVIDLGCGTGDALEQLPPSVRYIGVDISEGYVELAQKRFGARARFLVGTATTLLERGATELHGADLMVCNGLLHHLDDEEVLDVLELAATVLRPEGRFVCFEPTYLQYQQPLSRWVMGQDRGRNIRTDVEWSELVRRVFPDTSTRILTGLLRLPYTHVVIESTNTESVSTLREREVAPPLFRERAAGRGDRRAPDPEDDAEPAVRPR
jgi:SAM-dependent methyltransferase